MSYFTEVESHETYADQEDDFHFIYNANTGGGQSFLGGRFRDSSGNLQAPVILDGRTAQFCFRFIDKDDTWHNVVLNDEGTSYEIKPRAEGSRSMKFGVEGKPTPSDVVAAFLMLPETCGVQKSGDVNTSVLNVRNFWLQSMWLDVDASEENKVLFTPRDCIFSGGINKLGEGTQRYFSVDINKRIMDVIKASESDSLDGEVAKCVKHFSDIYQGKKTFVYGESIEVIKEVMKYLSSKYPETYSGTLDPMLIIRGLAHIKDIATIKADVRLDILAAIRTKPFILLAGISGTGKSRLVRQLARGCCPRYKTGTTDDHPFYDKQKPGNFEIIPVRPNWHDSTELMGYESRIGTPEFIIKPFVEFLVKAWMNPDIPFFLCLDEMNLAPVEQYFAEYLSAIESRKALNGGGRDYFKTDVVVKIGLPEKQWDDAGTSVLHNALAKLFEPYKTAGTLDAWATYVRDLFTKDGGVSIPQNLVVMGTVNMDETTCSFSRKVLDRAMSFELNDVSDMYAPDKLVGEGDYEFGSIGVAAAKCSLLTGKEAYDANVAVGDKVLEYLKIVNEALEGKKFKIAYRSRNEIMIYCIERTNGGIVGLRQALDEATSLKILSRIEGDDQTFASFDLKGFRKTIVKGLLAIDNPSVQDSDVEDFLKDEAKVKASPCASKLGHMIDELSHGAGVVSYWE